jgi:hypothetical protein
MQIKPLLFAVVLASCTQEEAKQKYEAAKDKAGNLASVAGEKAKEGAAIAADAAISAKNKTVEAAAVAGEKAGALAADAKEAAISAGEKAGEFASAAKGTLSTVISGAAASAAVISSIKTEFDKVYQSATTYDLEVSSEGIDDAGMKALEAQVSTLPNVTVGGAKVAYEDRSSTSAKGITYAKSFGAVWVVGGKKIGLTFYTQQNIDAKAFAETLQKLVPVVEKYIQ